MAELASSEATTKTSKQAEACGCLIWFNRLTRPRTWDSITGDLRATRLKSHVTGNSTRLDLEALRLNFNPNRSISQFYDTSVYQKLGEGVFGEVFTARHKESGKLRAVKLIRKERMSDPSTINDELGTLLRLDHPNVVDLHEWFEDAHSLYIVMDLYSGGDLHNLIQNCRNSEEIMRAFRHLMRAVSYCHEWKDRHGITRPVVHRDLKAENCLLTEGTEWTLKVVDFGLASIRSPTDTIDHWLTGVRGTPSYMSPEVVDMSDSYGLKCDIWSAGVILYLLLTDVHPFFTPECEGNIKRLFERISNMPYLSEPLDRVDACPEVRDLVDRMLRKEPQLRPTALEVLSHPWVVSEVQWDHARVRSVLKSVTGFGKTTHFERAILMVTAHSLCADQLEELRLAFVSLDKECSGRLSKENIKFAIRSLSMQISDDQLDSMFDAMNVANLGSVSYTEWLSATLHADLVASDKAVDAAFGFFDSDGDGSVSKSDLIGVLGEETAQHVMDKCDSGGGEFLNKDDFRRVCLQLAARRASANKGAKEHTKAAGIERLKLQAGRAKSVPPPIR